MHTVTTHDVDVPALGIGTFRFDADELCRHAVEEALEIGYRHIDTAQAYGTEGAVGDAVSASEIDRDEVFIVTKLDDGNRDHDAVLESTRQSLEDLQTEYVDLLLVHNPNETVPLEETIAAMNDLQDEGAVDHIGVSNFSVTQLRDAIETAETPIITNQVEYNPHTGRPELLAYCIDNDIMLTAYSPLDVGEVMDETVLAEIANRYEKTAPQVSIRWLLQQPMVAAIPKAAELEHVHENVDVFDFELTDEEMREIFALSDGLSDELRERVNL